MKLSFPTYCLLISCLLSSHASVELCTPTHIKVRRIQELDNKMVTESPIWSTNLPKAKCLEKCHLDSQCISVNLNPETEVCIGFQRHFEGLLAQTETVQGYQLLETRPSFLCTTNEYCSTNFGSSHCYENRCRCDIGYGLDGINCRVLTECVTFSDVYTVYPGYIKWGNDITMQFGQTLISCASLCINHASCETGDFNPNSGLCYLDDNNWFDVTEPLRSISPVYIYIQRECNW